MATFQEWLLEQDHLIDGKIDEYVEKQGIISPSSQRPTRLKQEKQRQKNELKQHLTIDYLHDHIEHAMQLIHTKMSDFVGSDDWKKTAEEFSNCQQSIEKFWKECQEGRHSERASYAEILGLSDETLLSIYCFGLHLFEGEELRNSLAIFGFLTLISPQTASFWLALGRNYQFMGNFVEAIEVYHQGKASDPNLGSLYCFSAECYEAMEDIEARNHELEQLKNIADVSLENQKVWQFAANKFSE